MDKKKKNKKVVVNRKLFIVIAVAAILAGCFMEWLCFFELKHYEDSFLQVYGMEQDGYVQVTIDQIKRLGDNATEAQITDIISSIDSSAKGYWTLTSEEDILFVKSVTETSKYKNLSADSYYNMDSSKEFINTLTSEEVVHDIIFINRDRYIASGGKFEWHGKTYTVCLMTYDYAILNQNSLLEAKNVIIVMVSVMVAVFICAIMIAVRNISKNLVRIAQYQSDEIKLNETIAKLQERINTYEAFTSKFHTYYPKALPVFMRSLYSKGVGPLYVIVLHFKDTAKVDDYLQRMLMATDENTLRFLLDDETLMVVMPGIDEVVGEQMATILETPEVEIVKREFWKHDYISYIRKYYRMMEVDDYAGTPAL
ncbi:MAG: hypothetical protein IK152_07685 [Lachnospiraceae bacterium]|nr:hypothetical protein [Lachnospiraceae bacterium]